MVKRILNSSSQELKDLRMQHWRLRPNQVCSNDDAWLTLCSGIKPNGWFQNNLAAMVVGQTSTKSLWYFEKKKKKKQHDPAPKGWRTLFVHISSGERSGPSVSCLICSVKQDPLQAGNTAKNWMIKIYSWLFITKVWYFLNRKALFCKANEIIA